MDALFVVQAVGLVFLIVVVRREQCRQAMVHADAARWRTSAALNVGEETNG